MEGGRAEEGSDCKPGVCRSMSASSRGSKKLGIISVSCEWGVGPGGGGGFVGTGVARQSLLCCTRHLPVANSVCRQRLCPAL
jgi:hypothetical protein